MIVFMKPIGAESAEKSMVEDAFGLTVEAS